MSLMWLLGWCLLVLGVVHLAKEKVGKKRPIALSDSWCLRPLDNWINLGHTVLKAANLPSTGSITTLARRLLNFYQGIGASAQAYPVFSSQQTQSVETMATSTNICVSFVPLSAEQSHFPSSSASSGSVSSGGPQGSSNKAADTAIDFEALREIATHESPLDSGLVHSLFDNSGCRSNEYLIPSSDAVSNSTLSVQCSSSVPVLVVVDTICNLFNDPSTLLSNFHSNVSPGNGMCPAVGTTAPIQTPPSILYPAPTQLLSGFTGGPSQDGHYTVPADCLSRFKVDKFRIKIPRLLQFRCPFLQTFGPFRAATELVPQTVFIRIHMTHCV